MQWSVFPGVVVNITWREGGPGVHIGSRLNRKWQEVQSHMTRAMIPPKTLSVLLPHPLMIH